MYDDQLTSASDTRQEYIRKMNSKLKTAGIIVLCALLIAIPLLVTFGKKMTVQTAGTETTASTVESKDESKAGASTESASSTTQTGASIKIDGNAMMDLWTDGAPLKSELISYMAEITDESSPKFIPVENRVAVFDFDGTLFCETDPNYFDYTLLVYRVLEDPNYKDKASDFEKEVARKIVEVNEKKTKFEGLEVDHGKAVASAFKGMTLDEFNNYIQEFKKQPMPSYEGMTRGEGFYKPMLQVIDYLKANDFTVYIISGTDRFIVRGIMYDSGVDIPTQCQIGSDETTVATGQNGEDGLEYQFKPDDQVTTGGEFIIKNLKMNKVSVIVKEIGKQPVLAFGNSSGDASMLEYTCSSNPYESRGFMLCCDDLVRENGNEKKADDMYKMCAEHGWTAVSMKNDWTTIYGDGVTKVDTPALDQAA